MENKSKIITFVLPVYNEQDGIGFFYAELIKVVQKIEQQNFVTELLFINDGSKDETLEKLKQISAKDSRVKVISFSRNFGHQIAITAGIDYAQGDAVIVMDSDLQDPPAVALELIEVWKGGKEVVYAKRRTRKDTLFKRATAAMFYWILNLVSDIAIPMNTGDFRLLDRKAVDAMKMYREKHRFMRGISVHIGFKQAEVYFDRDERKTGVTHYPFKKMVRFSFDAILGFSSAPLKLISRMGIVMSFFSILGIFYAVYAKLFQPETTVSGWAFVISSIFFIGGVQLIMLGIIGSYLARMYSELQDRPLYIVSEVIQR